jgi:anti-sigma factor RsiW
MSPCTAFEDRLLEYGELSPTDRHDVDEHVIDCASCRQYLALLREVDAALTAEVRGIRIDPQQYDAVRQLVMTAPAVARPSRLPEWMDFVAAGAVCAFGYGLAWQTSVFAYIGSVIRAWN